MIRPSLVFAIVISAVLQGVVLFWPVLFPSPDDTTTTPPATDAAAETPVIVTVADVAEPAPEPEPETTPEPQPEPIEEPTTPAPAPTLPEAPAPTTPTPEPTTEPQPEPEPTPTPAPNPAPEPSPKPEPVTPEPTPSTPIPKPIPTPEPTNDTPATPEPTSPTTPTAQPDQTEPTQDTTTPETAATPPSDSDRETGLYFNFRSADMHRLRQLRGVMVLIINDDSQVIDEVDHSTGTPRRKGRLPRDLLGPLTRGLDNYTTLEYASDQRNTRQRLGLAPNEKLFVALPNRLASEISHAYALKAEQMRRQGQTLGVAACQLEIRGNRVVPVITPID